VSTPCLLALGILGLGCADDRTQVDDAGPSSSTGESSGSGETETLGESADQDTSAETDTDLDTGDTVDTGDTETDAPPSLCGDGEVGPLEECDDGNTVDDDGCSNTCVSACGVDFTLDMTVDEGWFAVQDLRGLPGAKLALAGELEVSGQVRLRYVRANEGGIEQTLDSEVLGPGDATHHIQATAITDAGDIMALGRSAGIEDTAWLARYSGADLSEVWRVTLPLDDPQFLPEDLAVLASGDVVYTRTTEVADNDDDILFERRAFADGAVVWSSSFSGEMNGGWSLDRAARVAVSSPGDGLWVAGIVRVDFETHSATILEIDADDGAVLGASVPLDDPGGSQEQVITDFSAGPGSRVAIAINLLGPALQYHHSAVFMYESKVLAWSLLKTDLPWTEGAPYYFATVGLDDAGNTLVAGRYTHDFGSVTAPRVYVVKMSPTGEQLCNTRVGEGSDAVVVPASGFFGGGRGVLNLDSFGQGGMGPESGGNFIAGLRE